MDVVLALNSASALVYRPETELARGSGPLCAFGPGHKLAAAIRADMFVIIFRAERTESAFKAADIGRAIRENCPLARLASGLHLKGHRSA